MNKLIETIMDVIGERPMLNRQVVRFVLEWLAKTKMLNVEQLKKDIKLTTGEQQ